MSDLSREVFALQNAEQEAWLEKVFIRPAEYEVYASPRSAIIFGVPGSGKTALRLALAREAGEHALVVCWSPNPAEEDPGVHNTPLLNLVMKQVLRVCAETIVLRGGMSARYTGAKAWALDSLHWFLREHLPFGPELYVQSQASDLADEEINWYMDLFARPASEIGTANLTNQARIRLLLSTLKQAGFGKLWLTIDGLEKWPLIPGARVEEMLVSIFSTLAVFDHPDLVFKCFLPEAFKGLLEKTAGVERQRVEKFTLTWDAASLETLVRKRLVLLGDEQDSGISALCNDPAFAEWLALYGGYRPRAWLDLAKPFVETWQRKGQALNAKEWRKIASSRPPQLRLDKNGQQVWIGERLLPVTSVEFRILIYLYENRERVCSIEELHYRCVEQFNDVPQKNDAKWVHKDVWRRALDTTLWRIRQKLEPDPDHPIYLQNRHGQGYQLLHTAM